MRYIIYKTTNKVNGMYYIGRHATKNIDDGYMGSGVYIKNAIEKYGLENFEREIIDEASNSEELWLLEEQYVNANVVEDKGSYNTAYGGKNWIRSLKLNDPEKFTEHQRLAGIKGGAEAIKLKSKEWHSIGGKAAATSNKKNGDHPFYNGEAASLGGKAVKGMIELWHPESVASNKNQSEYVKGHSKKATIGSDKYHQLVNAGWLTIDKHLEKLKDGVAKRGNAI